MSFCVFKNTTVKQPVSDDDRKQPSAPLSCAACDETENKILRCYTPVKMEMYPDLTSSLTLSCVTRPNHNAVTVTNDKTLAHIPKNAIIDSIEFFGRNDFTTKDSFSIGVGQLNKSILMPLVVDTNTLIANLPCGGCILFNFGNQSGESDRRMVIYDSCINVQFTEPVQKGYLEIVIRYHLKK